MPDDLNTSTSWPQLTSGTSVTQIYHLVEPTMNYLKASFLPKFMKITLAMQASTSSFALAWHSCSCSPGIKDPASTASSSVELTSFSWTFSVSKEVASSFAKLASWMTWLKSSCCYRPPNIGGRNQRGLIASCHQQHSWSFVGMSS